MKKFIILLAVLIVLPAIVQGAPLKPATLFSNQSTVEAGTPIDLRSQPDEVTWTLAIFGGLSTFEVTLDASIDYPCSTATYYPVSTIDGTTTVLSRGVDFTGERCVRANLRSKAGAGGVTVKVLPRGFN